MAALIHPMASLRSAMVASSPAVLGAMLSACATVSATVPGDKAVATGREDFRGHVESVFRFQNQVASDLIREVVVDRITNPLPALALEQILAE